MALSKTNIYLLFKFMGTFGIECRRMSSLYSAIVCCRDSLANPLRPLDYASTETGAREVAIVFSCAKRTSTPASWNNQRVSRKRKVGSGPARRFCLKSADQIAYATHMKPLLRTLVVLLACAYLCGCCSLDCRNRNPIREDGSVFDPQRFPPSFT